VFASFFTSRSRLGCRVINTGVYQHHLLKLQKAAKSRALPPTGANSLMTSRWFRISKSGCSNAALLTDQA
jgi:hypothetical protein